MGSPPLNHDLASAGRLRESRSMRAPLLRSPAFPGADATVSRLTANPEGVPDDHAIAALFATIREARVGGCFWAPAADAQGAIVIVRARTVDDIDAVSARVDRPALWLLPAAQVNRKDVKARIGEAGSTENIDPWSLFDGKVELFAHGDDEWAALAVIAGCPVQLLSAGRFGEPEMDTAALERRIARDLIGTAYRDPYTGEHIGIAAAIDILADWRRTFEANRGIVAGCGFSWWKRREIARFLWTPAHPLRFFHSERRAIAHAARSGGAIAVWPSRVSAGMSRAAAARGVALVRVEDGFVRSVGLGSNLVPPASIAVDRLGIHYDPGAPSDLETLLANATFPSALLARAERLRATIVTAGISKYGSNGDNALPARQPGRRLVLVPGQVEDDRSVLLGGGGLTSNLELLRRARALEPDAEIWFRPHPDVDAGHRKGAVRDSDALRHADHVVRGGGMAQLLDRVDAVHVLTSLTGFEALLRGRQVTCHGTPFFAGWGLTLDLGDVPGRRGRMLTIDQLIAAVLILYPRYLDPVSGMPCPPEVLIGRMIAGAFRNRLDWVTRLRQLQGRLTKARA
jgi:capsular polysaccharide export protein